MKYCDDYAALLDLYVDGELSPEEISRVRDHLEQCPGCRAYVDDALAIRAAFPDAEDVEIPAGFAESVMARIQKEPVPKKKTPTSWRKVLPTLAACCALVILLQSIPGVFSGRKEKAAPASAAMDTAAPAMATESASEEKAEAAVEEPAAMMDRQIAAGSSNAVTEAEDAAPAECAEPQEAEKAAGPYVYAVSGTVYASILTLPPEGAALMAAYTPVSENGTEIQYELTAQEAEALLVQLETASFSYQSEEGIDSTTDLVLVILSK